MYELDMFELYDIASGCDKQKLPYSAGRISIASAEDEIEAYSTNSAVINISSSGGCAVLTIDFPLSMTKVWENTKKMAVKWLDNMDDYADDVYFTVLVMPYLLEGKINILFRDLCFCDGYATDKIKRLILAFDNNATCIYEDTDVDFDKVVIEMKAELRRREEEIDLELLSLDDEEKELNSKKYLKGINDLTGVDNIIKGKDKETQKFGGNPNVRTSSEVKND